jgi:translation initiation factor IF-2
MGPRDKSKSDPRGRPTAQKPGGKSPAPRGGTEGPAQGAPATPAPPPMPKLIELPESMTVRELARALRVNPIDIIKELMANGIVVSINQTIDYDTAEIVSSELGFETAPLRPEEPELEEELEEAPKTLRQRLAESEPPEKLKPRPPIVTVLGHVDHGKTTLLDAIRESNVVAGEFGGITQHIGAYQVEHQGRKITFLDTPGHEAFTAMRARGARVTDLAVLVVAADDGVMPQTREAIDHARAAGVPILVALNKMDLASARPERVKQQLADLDLTVEDWGGDVVCVPVSAKQKRGIDDLLENILLVTEVADLKSNPDRPAVGTVVEGQLDKQRGPTATLLIQAGTLRVGDALVIGTISGRVRAMLNERGAMVDEATPSMPVQVMGLSDVPKAGEIFEVVESERQARAIADERAERVRMAGTRPARPRGLTLTELFSQFQAGGVAELNLILKADVQGSLEPIANSVERLGTEDLKVKILRQGTGDVTESDVMLASASQAIVIGFQVEADEAARRMAAQEGVDIRLYNIIYKLVDDVDRALKGLLEPEYQDVVQGHAEVRAVFRIRRRGNVAGCYVTDGEVSRNAQVRVLRNGDELFDGHLDSLKRFQDDVPEVRAGFECGIGVAGFDEFEEGDILEFYTRELVS